MVSNAPIAGRSGGWPKRYTVVAMCFFASFICYIDRVNISVAAIAMQEELGWSDTTKGLVLSSFFVGYLLTQAIAGWAANRFGAKLILGLAVAWWSAFTILTPFAAYASFPLLIAARIALGLGEAATFPASYGMFGRWVPPTESARAISLLMSGIPLGTLFALITTGWIVTEYGWPASFYLFGAVGLVWAIAWFFLIHDDPEDHPSITERELAFIGPRPVAAASPGHVPWGKFLKTPAFWALSINHFCSNTAMYIFLAWLPSYFRDVFGLSIAGAGLYSAAPWLSMFLMMNAGGWAADTMLKRGVSNTAVRKILQTAGLGGSGLFLFFLRDVDSAGVAVLMMCGALGATSLTVAGFGTNHLDIAPRYAGVLVGITNTFGTIPGIIGVAVTGWLVNTTGSYDSVFLMVAAVNVVGIVVWLAFASGRKLID